MHSRKSSDGRIVSGESAEAVERFLENDARIRAGQCPNKCGALELVDDAGQYCPKCHFSCNVLPKPAELFVTVIYTCNGPTCPARNVPVNVRAREPGETLGPWIQRMEQAVAHSHASIAPNCGYSSADIKIPMAREGEPLGAPTKQ